MSRSQEIEEIMKKRRNERRITGADQDSREPERPESVIAEANAEKMTGAIIAKSRIGDGDIPYSELKAIVEVAIGEQYKAIELGNKYLLEYAGSEIPDRIKEWFVVADLQRKNLASWVEKIIQLYKAGWFEIERSDESTDAFEIRIEGESK